ncbi:MAG: YbjN domain-containing protein [Armatimonadetes bacterium]|nr:YbjN domain-containing protein [Armatimonadota bacterium]
MSTRSLRLFALLATLVLLPASAQAKKMADASNTAIASPRFTADAPEIYKAISIDLLEAACKSMDLKPERGKDNDGDPCLTLDFDGIKTVLLMYGDAKECKSMAMQASWELPEDADMAVANDWNRARRFTRAYVTDKVVVLESDLDIEGGVTAETIGRWVGQFKAATAKFVEHMKAKG